MYGGWTEYAVFYDSFEIYKMFPRCIIFEFERKVDVQIINLGGYVFRIGFFIIK